MDWKFLIGGLFLISPFTLLVALCIYSDSISREFNESDDEEGEE